MSATRGVIIGKFQPFHLGHEHLIRSALERVDRLVVLVCETTSETIPASVRARWILDTFGADARLEVITRLTDHLADDDSRAWAAYTVDLLGAVPDVCFTSEPYGDAWAGYMGCRHVCVDLSRSTVKTSGTEIRSHPLAHLHALPPATRAYFVRRVCIVGAESTGKTTLASDLAERLHASWVPEYGRLFCEALPDAAAHVWTSEDFLHIAREQHRLEDEAARVSGPVLVCDTDAFTTGVFHRHYLDQEPPAELVALQRRYPLYVLTDPETPFEQDPSTGLRDERWRSEMQDAHEARLSRERARVVRVKGSPRERSEQAATAVWELLAERIVIRV